MFAGLKAWALKKVLVKIIGTIHGKIDTPEDRVALATSLVDDNRERLIKSVVVALEKGDIILDKYDA